MSMRPLPGTPEASGDSLKPSSSPHPASAARTAVVMVTIFGAVLWVVQVIDSLDGYRLERYGIVPRSIGKLEDIFSAPFIHASYSHVIGNTVPLLILGFLVGLRGIWRFLGITFVIMVVSGLGVWLTSPSGSDTVGASGVIFGYFGYLVARGIFERKILDLVVGLLVGVLYWSILPEILPGHAGISWEAHLFGLLGGLLAAWTFRERRVRIAPGTEPTGS